MNETELIARMRKAASAIYLATDAVVAADISSMLIQAADALEHAEGVRDGAEHAI